MSRFIFISLAVLFLILYSVSNLWAGAPPPPPPPPLSVPVDGGAILLLAAGAFVAGKKLMDKDRK